MNKRYCLLVLTLSSLAAAISLSAQFFFHRLPCPLCQVQRIVYLLLAAASSCALLPSLRNLASKGCVLLAALNLCVSAYHTLVQFRLLDDRCPHHSAAADPLAYKTMLLKDQTPGCSDDSSKIGPVPLPLLSTLASLLLLCLIQKGAKLGGRQYCPFKD